MKKGRCFKLALTLTLLSGLLLGGAFPAAALEVNVSGQMVFQWGFRDNYDHWGDFWKYAGEDTSGEHFFARQRARIQTEFVASENLKGVLQLQFGVIDWGEVDSGGQLDTNSASGKVRRAYIDWNVEGTSLNLKMGLQEIALPSAVAGNPILDSHVAAVTLSGKLSDQISLTGFWARPYHNAENAALHKYKHNSTGMFGLLADFNYENVVFQPYLLYSRIGDNSGWGLRGSAHYNGDTDYYLAGLALQVKPTDRLTIGLDTVYNYMKNDSSSVDPAIWGAEKDFDKSSGWFSALGVDYAQDFGTVGLVAWYASGNDYDDYTKSKPKNGRIQSISTDVIGFAPSRLAFKGAYAIGDDSLISRNGAGTWGAGLHLKDFSFVEDLSHTVRFVYFQGTNYKEMINEYTGRYMTTKDKAFEVDLDSSYEIAKGFKAIVEMAYVKLDFKDRYNGWMKAEDDVWNVQITLDYSF